LGDDELITEPIVHALVDEHLRRDADDLAAIGAHGIRQMCHQPNTVPAVDERPVVLRNRAAKIDGGINVNGIDGTAGGTIDGDGTSHHQTIAANNVVQKRRPFAAINMHSQAAGKLESNSTSMRKQCTSVRPGCRAARSSQTRYVRSINVPIATTIVPTAIHNRPRNGKGSQ